jgi:hypothetical protein
MTTRIAPSQNQTSRATLETIIGRWEARWRQMRLWWRLPRALLLILVVLVVVTLVVRTLGIASQSQAFLLTGMGIAIGIGVFVGWLYRKRPMLDSAQQFDALFGLQERISTALEIDAGKIQTAPQIAERQMDDAIATAETIDANDYIELKISWLEWVFVVILTIALAIVLLLPSAGGGG